MPARDIHHNQVKKALIKDGWTITADPYTIRYEDAELFADLAAEKLIAAERNKQKIIVEVKSFLSPSPIRDFQTALGQYILYRNLMTLTEPEYRIYLAIKESVYKQFFKRKSIQAVLEQNNIFIIVVDTDREIIIRWIN